MPPIFKCTGNKNIIHDSNRSAQTKAMEQFFRPKVKAKAKPVTEAAGSPGKKSARPGFSTSSETDENSEPGVRAMDEGKSPVTSSKAHVEKPPPHDLKCYIDLMVGKLPSSSPAISQVELRSICFFVLRSKIQETTVDRVRLSAREAFSKPFGKSFTRDECGLITDACDAAVANAVGLVTAVSENPIWSIGGEAARTEGEVPDSGVGGLGGSEVSGGMGDAGYEGGEDGASDEEEFGDAPGL